MSAGRIVWSGSAVDLDRDAPASAYTLHTSDDPRALELAGALGQDGLIVEPGSRGGLALLTRPETLDALVAQLGSAGVLIRRLEWLVSPLESMFFSLTTDEVDDLAPEAFADAILARR
jgi:hypothetical protein